MRGLHATPLHATRQRVQQPVTGRAASDQRRLLHAGMQTLDSWLLAQTNAFDISERN